MYILHFSYESGGAMFPYALQRTLSGLILGQLTLIGYLITRGFYFQPIFLLPLPFVTLWGMRYFDQVFHCTNCESYNFISCLTLFLNTTPLATSALRW